MVELAPNAVPPRTGRVPFFEFPFSNPPSTWDGVALAMNLPVICQSDLEKIKKWEGGSISVHMVNDIDSNRNYVGRERRGEGVRQFVVWIRVRGRVGSVKDKISKAQSMLPAVSSILYP